MEKVGAYSFSVEPYLSDFRGRATLPMLGNYLIHAASEHAAGRGFGFTDMSENNTAWVVEAGSRDKRISYGWRFYNCLYMDK